MPSQFLRNRWLTCLNPFFIPSYPWSWCFISIFNSSNFPVCIPPSLLCTPDAFTGGVQWETGRDLVLCKHISATTLVCDHHCLATNPKHSITPPALQKINSISARQCNCYSQQIVAVICLLWYYGKNYFRLTFFQMLH